LLIIDNGIARRYRISLRRLCRAVDFLAQRLQPNWETCPMRRLIKRRLIQSSLRALVTSLAAAGAASVALAAQINTGGDTGAYHGTFCPSLSKQLELVGSTGECLVSSGTGENLRRVARNPDEFGYGQLDVLALESENYSSLGGSKAFQIVRSDDVRECVFAVTRNKNYTNFGELAVNADRLRFILPPKTSGSAKTFEFLQKIDPQGLGLAKNIVNATSTDEAIELAMADENAVTFFVQFPDPNNPRFKKIRQSRGHIVPVVDGIILRQKIDGQTIYYAQETSISQLKWLNLGKRVITVCTPLVLFTGATNRISGDDRAETRSKRSAHRQLVLNIRSMTTKELIPPQSPFAKIIDRTRQLSNRARYHFQELSLNARERARPLFDRMYRGAGHIVRMMVLKARPPEYIRQDSFER